MVKDEMKMTFTQTITREEMRNRISMALKDPILQQGFEIICKENTELKSELTKKADTNHSLVEQMADLESENAELKDALKGKRCNCMTYLNFKDLEKELTKAKEIIALGLRVCETSSIEYMNLYQKQAEQFLEKVR